MSQEAQLLPSSLIKSLKKVEFRYFSLFDWNDSNVYKLSVNYYHSNKSKIILLTYKNINYWLTRLLLALGNKYFARKEKR